MDKRALGPERSLEQALERSSAKLEGWLAADQSTPSQRVARQEQALRVAEALASLPEAPRQALDLLHWQGWTLAEIAAHMGKSRAAVAGLIKRGLEQLRRKMKMSKPDPSGHEQHVNEVIAGFLEAVEAGKAPNPEEFLSQHAEITTELKAFFAAREQFASPVAPPQQAADEPQSQPEGVDRMAPTLVPGKLPADAILAKVRSFGDYELLHEIARGGMGSFTRHGRPP
jgi:hypothetical protein